MTARPTDLEATIERWLDRVDRAPGETREERTAAAIAEVRAAVAEAVAGLRPTCSDREIRRLLGVPR